MENILAMIFGSLFCIISLLIAVIFLKTGITALTKRNSIKTNSSLINCESCEKKVSINASFCPSCGHKLSGLEGYNGTFGFIVGMSCFLIFTGFSYLIGNEVYQELIKQGLLPRFFN